jgi:hypothetical protein
MARGEGGMNLDMPSGLITELTARGAVAGERLVTAFSGPIDKDPAPEEQWNDHRFARYRVLMSVLEAFLRRFADGYEAKPPVTTPYPERVDQGMASPYKFQSQAELAAAKAANERYVRAAKESAAHSLDDANVPRPPATLRTVPPV